MRRAASVVLPVLLGIAGCGGHAAVPAKVATPALSRAIGWYTDERASIRQLQLYRQAGANLMVGYHVAGQTERWLRALRRTGLLALLQPDPRWIARGDLAALRAFVQRYGSNPVVYGWYLYDEPEFTGLPPSRLVAAYRTIKAVDRKPVAVVFASSGCRFGPTGIDTAYLSGFDLLMFDYFPFYTDMPRFDPLHGAVVADRQCVRSAHQYDKRGPYIVVQAFGRGQRDGPFLWRDPTNVELQCSVDLALATGAQGVMFWGAGVADSGVQRDAKRIAGALPHSTSTHTMLHALTVCR